MTDTIQHLLDSLHPLYPGLDTEDIFIAALEELLNQNRRNLMEHTPIPWKVYPSRPGVILPYNGLSIEEDVGMQQRMPRQIAGLIPGESCAASFTEEEVKANAQFIAKACNEYEWMRREIERVGVAMFTNTIGEYTGTEEDLQSVGQFVEGVCDGNDRLREQNDRLEKAIGKFAPDLAAYAVLRAEIEGLIGYTCTLESMLIKQEVKLPIRPRILDEKVPRPDNDALAKAEE